MGLHVRISFSVVSCWCTDKDPGVNWSAVFGVQLRFLSLAKTAR